MNNWLRSLKVIIKLDIQRGLFCQKKLDAKHRSCVFYLFWHFTLRFLLIVSYILSSWHAWVDVGNQSSVYYIWPDFSKPMFFHKHWKIKNLVFSFICLFNDVDAKHRSPSFATNMAGHLWSRVCQHLERKILSKRLLLNSFMVSIHISLLL